MDACARFVDAGALRLYAELEGRGAPLLLLHGFTGSTRSMEGLARELSGDYRTLRLDLAGHGRSDAPHAADLYAMPRCVDQVARAVRELCSGRVHVIGYSMGGRVALALCATHPELVASALLIGARAGIEDPEERAARRRDDAALADRIERDGVRAFVDAWLAQPLFASQARLSAEARAAARAQRLENRAHGLAGSLRGLGAGSQPPLFEALPRIDVPICLVVGAEDARFRDIAQDLVRRLPDARLEIVPEAGHAAHLENPEAFLCVARRFLARVDASRPKPGTRPEPNPVDARNANP
ncbi:MAG: 2-succinyl-6-hydroxy-2,4-cyclohexadiene-1-carboxylate synthase [Deltaproteobacteria bacterium]|nr:MAG: 2-succinyl-6-hydroxy-2,4-cyclohexadiene-1-carboxylate synthase [Deltaproteobacteria bacterium]